MLTRVFVIYGQGGVLFSTGMSTLANKIAAGGIHRMVTTHSWKDHARILEEISKLDPTTKIVLVGYSMGANTATYIASQVKRVIHLMVLYDPSKGLPGLPAWTYRVGKNVKKTLHYKGKSFLGWGMAPVVGHNIQKIDTNIGHARLHLHYHGRTLAAIKEALE